jgi:hypothetical protein
VNRIHTDAVIVKLQAAGLTVGDAQAPSNSGPPYCIVYPLPGGDSFGTLQNPNEDADLPFQVTCVGVSRKQAEWVADQTLTLLGGLSVAGRAIVLVTLDSFGGARPDHDVSPPVYSSTPRYRVKSTPA